MGYLLPDITLIDGVISLFFVAVVAFFLFRQPRSVKPKKSPLPSVPIVTDAHFEEKLARYIRAKLATKYSPEHTSSHTVKEIESYGAGDTLLTLLTRLEEIEYTSKTLSESERQGMLKTLKKY